MSNIKLSAYSVSPALQRLFTYCALAVYLLTTTQLIWQAGLQLTTNPNLSAYYWITIYSMVAPLVFFVIAFLLSNRRESQQTRIFISVFLTVCGMLALSAVNILVTQLIVAFTIVLPDPFWSWLLYEVATAAAVTAAYAIALFALRRKNKF